MPVILENGSEEITTWLDPKRSTWSKELQSLLRPFKGELEVYPVSKEVGKVGNNSETFIIPVASSQNKSNIANFFSKGASKGDRKPIVKSEPEQSTASASKVETDDESTKVKRELEDDNTGVNQSGTGDNLPHLSPKIEVKHGIKRELEDDQADETPTKMSRISISPSKISSPSRSKLRSATSNNSASPKKSTNKDKGSQKITSFFTK